mmetsp:Transcript_5470/g.16563  ORF Transcript_5470/g.16563 Transcript_5470/m.16563 type:complete len:223 (-) Transcript_5470:316-984(-)
MRAMRVDGDSKKKALAQPSAQVYENACKTSSLVPEHPFYSPIRTAAGGSSGGGGGGGGGFWCWCLCAVCFRVNHLAAERCTHAAAWHLDCIPRRQPPLKAHPPWSCLFFSASCRIMSCTDNAASVRIESKSLPARLLPGTPSGTSRALRLAPLATSTPTPPGPAPAPSPASDANWSDMLPGSSCPPTSTRPAWAAVTAPSCASSDAACCAAPLPVAAGPPLG